MSWKYISGVLGSPGAMCERFYENEEAQEEMIIKTHRKRDGDFGVGKIFVRKIGEKKWVEQNEKRMVK